MRTLFVYVGLLGLVAAGVVSSGCDSIHTGQPKDPSGPDRMLRMMVQNDDLSVAFDLLDTPGSLLSLAVACDDLNPCGPHFLLNGNTPDFTCGTDGKCKDPLMLPAAGIPVDAMDPHYSIRVVFEKLLDASIEEPSAAGAAFPFTLKPGILQVTTSAGPVAGDAYYDLSGPAFETSDPIASPYGPALVFVPSAVLPPSTTFTIDVNAGMLQDRDGNPVGDQDANPISGHVTKTFTTAAM